MLDLFAEPDHSLLVHHEPVSFSSNSQHTTTSSQGGLSTGASIGIGMAIASSVGGLGYLGYRVIKPMTLRESSVQVPDFDPASFTPTGGNSLRLHASSTPRGETGDLATEFLSPTPSGRVKKNSRARFF
jgi:hypothetical protein